MTALADVPEEAVCIAVDASVEFVKERLLQTHRKIKTIIQAKVKNEEEADKDPDKKFSVREMSTGSIDNFHEGLQDRIGEAQCCLRLMSLCLK